MKVIKKKKLHEALVKLKLDPKRADRIVDLLEVEAESWVDHGDDYVCVGVAREVLAYVEMRGEYPAYEIVEMILGKVEEAAESAEIAANTFREVIVRGKR